MPDRYISNLIHLQKQICRWLFFLIAALFLSSPAAGGEINTRLSRNPVTIDESFQLIVESDGATDSDPDFSVLEQDFRIVSQSQSQNIQMINGDVSRSTNWQLTLMARRTGRLTIPPIPFGSDSSKPLTLQVEKAAPPEEGLSGDDIFLKVETEPERAYQGQQILLRIQLYRAVSTDNASLSQPETDDPDILIKKLGEDEQYETHIGNRRYLVVERRYAMFTRKAGRLNLAPLVFQGEVIKPGSRRDSLFGSPFTRFGSAGEVRRVQSSPISIEIEPSVSRTAGQPWLPSSNLQLVENWGQENRQFTVGEPVTRTLMLFADGLTSAQLPEIKTELPEGLKQYPDQPVLRDRESKDGITGIRQVKVAIVPSRNGRFTLPAINIDWWNLETRSMETASIPEQQIEVLPAAGENFPVPAMEPAAPQTEQLAPLITADDGIATYTLLPALTIIFGLGWLGTSIAWWYSSKKGLRTSPGTTPKRAKPGTTDRHALRAACLANDPQASARELLKWGGCNWPELQPLTLGGIAENAVGHGLKKEIAQLERCLYAEVAAPWRGADLWQQLENERRAASARPGAQEIIAPMYPN